MVQKRRPAYRYMSPGGLVNSYQNAPKCLESD